MQFRMSFFFEVGDPYNSRTVLTVVILIPVPSKEATVMAKALVENFMETSFNYNQTKERNLIMKFLNKFVNYYNVNKHFQLPIILIQLEASRGITGVSTSI